MFWSQFFNICNVLKKKIGIVSVSVVSVWVNRASCRLVASAWRLWENTQRGVFSWDPVSSVMLSKQTQPP